MMFIMRERERKRFNVMFTLKIIIAERFCDQNFLRA